MSKHIHGLFLSPLSSIHLKKVNLLSDLPSYISQRISLICTVTLPATYLASIHDANHKGILAVKLKALVTAYNIWHETNITLFLTTNNN
jgi:hypothetical protein